MEQNNTTATTTTDSRIAGSDEKSAEKGCVIVDKAVRDEVGEKSSPRWRETVRMRERAEEEEGWLAGAKGGDGSVDGVQLHGLRITTVQDVCVLQQVLQHVLSR